MTAIQFKPAFINAVMRTQLAPTPWYMGWKGEGEIM